MNDKYISELIDYDVESLINPKLIRVLLSSLITDPLFIDYFAYQKEVKIVNQENFQTCLAAVKPDETLSTFLIKPTTSENKTLQSGVLELFFETTRGQYVASTLVEKKFFSASGYWVTPLDPRQSQRKDFVVPLTVFPVPDKLLILLKKRALKVGRSYRKFSNDNLSESEFDIYQENISFPGNGMVNPIPFLDHSDKSLKGEMENISAGGCCFNLELDNKIFFFGCNMAYVVFPIKRNSSGEFKDQLVSLFVVVRNLRRSIDKMTVHCSFIIELPSETLKFINSGIKLIMV